MAGRLTLVALMLGLAPAVVTGQLSPDDTPPSRESLKPLFSQMLEKRDALAIPANVGDLTNAAARVAEVLKLARQLQNEEGDSSPGKRYGLVVEGLEALHSKLERIPVLIARNEFYLAADVVDAVAIMDRLWSGKPATELTQWASDLRRKEEEQKDFLRTVNQTLNQAANAGDSPSLREALAEKLRQQRDHYGDVHSELIETLLALWQAHFESGLIGESRSFISEAHQLSKEVFGPGDWKTVDSGALLTSMDQLMDLDPQVQKRILVLWTRSWERLQDNSVDIDRFLSTANRELAFADKSLGLKSPLLAGMYLRFAGLAKSRGELEYAVAFFLRGTDAAMQAYGELHPLTCRALQDWSVTCKLLDDDERAFSLATKAVEMNRKLYGEGSKQYLQALETVGEFYFSFEHDSEALYVFKKLQRIKSLLGEQEDAQSAEILQNLALVHLRMKDFPAAREDAQTALKLIDEDNRIFIELLSILANCDKNQRRFESALLAQQRVVELAKEKFGQNRVEYAYQLENLADLQWLIGQRQEAAQSMEAALEIIRRDLDRMGSLQGRRLRVNSYEDERASLSNYLTLAAELGDRDRSACEQVIAWKGSAMRQGRVLMQARNNKSEVVFDQRLQTIADAISNLITVVDSHSDQSIPIERLNTLLQAWEDGHRGVVFNEGQEYKKFAVDEIQSKLPADAALVEIYEYQHVIRTNGGVGDPPASEARYLAFVVRRDAPVRMIPLGSAAEVDDLIVKWRKQIALQLSGAPLNATGWALSELVWKPIAEVIGQPKHILVCPDGMLSIIPWAAIPVDRSGKYLIEESRISLLPYVDFLEIATQTRDSDDTPVVTVVGDIDYLTPPGQSASRMFSPLPGTEREVRALQVLYNEAFPKGKLTSLMGGSGSEANVRVAAMQSNYLHVATHGFYAPGMWPDNEMSDEKKAFRQRVREFVPEAMSALVLAGANRGLDTSDVQNPNVFGADGILTGLEVISMDLRKIDLVSLSACETGVGTVASGTGKLGLELSFLAAGADSVMSSLWQVDDAATATLMVEFYRNMWSGKMSKAEALQEAQLTMLNRYDPKSSKLRPRGLKLANSPDGRPAGGRLPPFYWAPFTLSGDWR